MCRRGDDSCAWQPQPLPPSTPVPSSATSQATPGTTAPLPVSRNPRKCTTRRLPTRPHDAQVLLSRPDNRSSTFSTLTGRGLRHHRLLRHARCWDLRHRDAVVLGSLSNRCLAPSRYAHPSMCFNLITFASAVLCALIWMSSLYSTKTVSMQ